MFALAPRSGVDLHLQRLLENILSRESLSLFTPGFARLGLFLQLLFSTPVWASFTYTEYPFPYVFVSFFILPASYRMTKT